MRSGSIQERLALAAVLPVIAALTIGGMAAASDSQDNPGKAKPVEGKKAVKTVDVRLRVVTEGGDQIPSGEVVISLEEKCWPEATPDPRQAIETKTGEVAFNKLPACAATVIMKVDGYTLVEMEMNGKKQTTRSVDLKEYKTPIVVTLRKLQ